MPTEGPNWELRVSAVWASLDDRTEADFLAAIDELVAERPADDPAAVFEHAAALDSTGHSDLAVPLYRQALDDAVRAFLALALVDAGREREAVAVALTALAPHLPRYQRSVTNYAAALQHGR